MNDSVISLNDLFPGMQLENDLHDQFNNLLFKKGTVLTNEHLKELTTEKQAFFKYNLERHETEVDVVPLLVQINLFLRKVTFVEECGIDLDEMEKNYYFPDSLLESDWERRASYDYIKKINYSFIEGMTKKSPEQLDATSHENVVVSCEKIAFWLNEIFWLRQIAPFVFYHTSLKWVEENTIDLLSSWQKFFVPYPEQTNIIMKNGNTCEVVSSSSQTPFSPLLKLAGEKEGATYFVEDLTSEVEKVLPLQFDFEKY
ncbi:hypothetical protein [Salipaludibacillus daqingensis]|uniref:hypothetical protein n=1 Tax=Salipaludibacillus daqingensis TaxID=3041001 RepID=UPI0024761D27|nr:hypothetical protein [Salipaludibacillus daqingensis]